MEEEIPKFAEKLAKEPIDSPWWHDSLGEEYISLKEMGYLITNVKVGPYRIREVCKVIKEFKVEPEVK